MLHELGYFLLGILNKHRHAVFCYRPLLNLKCTVVSKSNVSDAINNVRGNMALVKENAVSG